jgi:hypothetical protein
MPEPWQRRIASVFNRLMPTRVQVICPPRESIGLMCLNKAASTWKYMELKRRSSGEEIIKKA